MFTFDDGYQDHLICSEILSSMGHNGAFFPPINITRGDLLHVNAIHYLLGLRCLTADQLLNFIVDYISREGLTVTLPGGPALSIDCYLEKDLKHRYDDSTSLFVKRLLQRDISDESRRAELIEYCFEAFSDLSMQELADSLYLTPAQMVKMKSQGMCFGSHGLTHRWLNSLSSSEQQSEIAYSFAELERLSLVVSEDSLKIMCYPFGAYNDITLKLMHEQDVDYCLSTSPGPATASSPGFSFLALPRWDTNDFWDDNFRRPVIPT